MTLETLSYSRSSLPALLLERTASFLLEFKISGRGTISLRYDASACSDPKATRVYAAWKTVWEEYYKVWEYIGSMVRVLQIVLSPGTDLPGNHSLFLLFFQSHLLPKSSHLVAQCKPVATAW